MTTPQSLSDRIRGLPSARRDELLAYLCGWIPREVEGAVVYLDGVHQRDELTRLAGAGIPGLPDNPEQLVGRRVTRTSGVYGLPLTGQIIARLPDDHVRVAWGSISTDEPVTALVPAGEPDQPDQPDPPPHPNTLAQLVDDLEAKVTGAPFACSNPDCHHSDSPWGAIPADQLVGTRVIAAPHTRPEGVPTLRGVVVQAEPGTGGVMVQWEGGNPDIVPAFERIDDIVPVPEF